MSAVAESVRAIERPSFPTILLAAADSETRRALAERLRDDGYFVLEACDRMSTIRVVQLHSRRIHVLVIGDDIDDGDLAAQLKRYRAGMLVVVMPHRSQSAFPDPSASESVLAEVHSCFE